MDHGLDATEYMAGRIARTIIQALRADQSLTDSFTVTSLDGTASQLVTATIHGTNDGASITGTSTGDVTEDVALVGGNLSTSGDLTVHDVDNGQAFAVAQPGTPGSNGYGTFTVDANGHWTYTADDSQAERQQ